jgi:hypothetical protein
MFFIFLKKKRLSSFPYMSSKKERKWVTKIKIYYLIFHGNLTLTISEFKYYIPFFMEM